jgi:hypothetical protein
MKTLEGSGSFWKLLVLHIVKFHLPFKLQCSSRWHTAFIETLVCLIFSWLSHRLMRCHKIETLNPKP